MRGTHHQAERIISFRSNNVDFFILTRFFNRIQNLFCHEPLSGRAIKTTMIYELIHVLMMSSNSARYAYHAVSCWWKSPPCEWHISTFAWVLHHLEIWKHALSGHYRSCPCNEVHNICAALLGYHLEKTLATEESNNNVCITCWVWISLRWFKLVDLFLKNLWGLIHSLNFCGYCSTYLNTH